MEDREQALSSLVESRNRLRATVAGLSEEQRRFRPAPDRWSIVDCIEHLTVVEKFTLARTQRLLQEAPANTPETQGKDDVILTRVPGRAQRVKGPEAVLPTGRWPDFEELMRQFETARQQTIDFARDTQAGLLRERHFPHPFLGPLDCQQWLLFLGAHCERHVRQMEEVKADPAFPGHAGSAMA